MVKKNTKSAFRSPPKATPVASSSKTDKMKADWKYMTSLFDQIPHGQPLKTKHTFTKNDVVLISQYFKRKFVDYEQLIKYEKDKN